MPRFCHKTFECFIKIENCLKNKKPANPKICRFTNFLWIFEKIEKVTFLFLYPFGGESRIRTCEVHTADLQSALVGRLSISPLSFVLLRFVVLSGCKYSNVFHVCKQKMNLILSYFKVIF